MKKEHNDRTKPPGAIGPYSQAVDAGKLYICVRPAADRPLKQARLQGMI